jgi:hypothetical protein
MTEQRPCAVFTGAARSNLSGKRADYDTYASDHMVFLEFTDAGKTFSRRTLEFSAGRRPFTGPKS